MSTKKDFNAKFFVFVCELYCCGSNSSKKCKSCSHQGIVSSIFHALTKVTAQFVPSEATEEQRYVFHCLQD